jgi:hypothetical protein
MKPGFHLDPTDIIALMLMALFSIRRINVRGTDARAYPQIPIGVFEAWKAQAVRSRSISINACFLKFALNSVWFFVFGRHVIPPVLATGGWLIFLGWVGAMTYAWYLAAGAESVADGLRIVPGTRLAEDRQAAEDVTESPAPGEREA